MEIPSEFASIEGIQDLVSVPNPGDVNCHKALLYLAGYISYEELTSDSKLQREQGLDFTFAKRALDISNKEFVSIADSDELVALARKDCAEDVPYIGQILDVQDKALAHSFLIAQRGDGFICLDKAGFKEAFSIYSLEELLNFSNYRDQLWRFMALNEVK
jgi:hypothetical protein